MICLCTIFFYGCGIIAIISKSSYQHNINLPQRFHVNKKELNLRPLMDLFSLYMISQLHISIKPLDLDCLKFGYCFVYTTTVGNPFPWGGVVYSSLGFFEYWSRKIMRYVCAHNIKTKKFRSSTLKGWKFIYIIQHFQLFIAFVTTTITKNQDSHAIQIK